MSTETPTQPEESTEPELPPGLVVVRSVDVFGTPTEHVVTDSELAAWQWGCRGWYPSPPNIPPRRPWTR
jgi:hypothetical protein